MKVKMSFANIGFEKIAAIAVCGALGVVGMSMLERKVSRGIHPFPYYPNTSDRQIIFRHQFTS